MTLDELHNESIACPECEGFTYPVRMIGFILTLECEVCFKRYRHDLREGIKRLERETEHEA